MKQKQIKTPIGPLFLVASETGLRGVHWQRQEAPMGVSPILNQAAQQLDEYFAGRREKFELTLESEGTPFQKKVWAVLAKIPFGTTISYAELAKRVGSPRAMRAVGTANGRNAFNIVVPCHRVIASSGRLGGYSGGLPKKAALLDLEK